MTRPRNVRLRLSLSKPSRSYRSLTAPSRTHTIPAFHPASARRRRPPPSGPGHSLRRGATRVTIGSQSGLGAMRFQLHSHRHAGTILAEPRYAAEWDELQEVARCIDDAALIDRFQSGRSSNSLSAAINILLRQRLTHLGWTPESAIFADPAYKFNGPKRWRLDLAKGNDRLMEESTDKTGLDLLVRNPSSLISVTLNAPLARPYDVRPTKRFAAEAEGNVHPLEPMVRFAGLGLDTHPVDVIVQLRRANLGERCRHDTNACYH